jgi:hypothetical protein
MVLIQGKNEVEYTEHSFKVLSENDSILIEQGVGRGIRKKGKKIHSLISKIKEEKD